MLCLATFKFSFRNVSFQNGCFYVHMDKNRCQPFKKSVPTNVSVKNSLHTVMFICCLPLELSLLNFYDVLFCKYVITSKSNLRFHWCLPSKKCSHNNVSVNKSVRTKTENSILWHEALEALEAHIKMCFAREHS